MRIHKHRKRGYNLLSGEGLEIGALHEAAKLPASCKVEYVDVISKDEAIKRFPEVDHHKLVNVSYISNIDKDSLTQFKEHSFDFVICSHVIEHLANPINCIESLFRITKIGGQVVIAVPDKNYTFDRSRSLTSFEHLKEEFKNNITEVTDEHYLDFLNAVHPDVMNSSPEAAIKALKSVRERKEHAHVWTSESFKDFLIHSYRLLSIRAQLQFESTGNKNHFEYFSVWKLVNESSEMITTYKPKGLFNFLNLK